MFIRCRKMVRAGVEGFASYASATYEDAVKALNGLQSNESVIRSRVQNPYCEDKLRGITKYLARAGISLDSLDDLSVIHVAGTKGKGSSCVFAESLLQSHGIRTGVYTSPHLITVRERFRINGKSIDEEKFAKYFFKVYEILHRQRENDVDMPPYFTFLTILMFRIFLESPIDVAIIEVGIGGEYDCTNVLRKPSCVGITSLGLDHTSLLGNTITEIAHQKSGIFKTDAPAFSVPQTPEAAAVLKKRAREKNCTLNFVKNLDIYEWTNGNIPKLGINGDFQSYNASLAVRMVSSLLRTKFSNRELFSFDTAARALTNCKWPGREQFFPGEFADFYLDGAHTIESIEHCASWFRRSTIGSTGKNFLIFNMIGDRDSVEPLKILRSLNFREAFFVPNVVGKTAAADQINYNVPESNQTMRCDKHCKIWGEGSRRGNNVRQVLERLKRESEFSSERINVLVTGSLHLVGAVLAVLDPDLSTSTKI